MLLQYLTLGLGVETLLPVKHNQLLLSKHASTLVGEQDSLFLIDCLPHMFLQYLYLVLGVGTLVLVKHNQSLLISPIFENAPKDKVKRCSTMHHIL
ncbi:hypothetical protein CXB51_029274 [Gossypium anomalum]|uniref:Uncharacterized protein n=1 Tax=Gossypium anomalum TaxID=47600 RepID=A0A8J5Y8G0_9ROSI|nr:hypothetical protein CXB51_029274 [Gossypium anomalum]